MGNYQESIRHIDPARDLKVGAAESHQTVSAPTAYPHAWAEDTAPSYDWQLQLSTAQPVNDTAPS